MTRSGALHRERMCQLVPDASPPVFNAGDVHADPARSGCSTRGTFVASTLPMRGRAPLYIAALAFASIAACGGLSNEGQSNGVGPGVGAGASSGTASGSAATGARTGSAGTGSGRPTLGAGGSSSTVTDPPQPTPPTRVPEQHRASGATCDHERSTGNARPYNELSACPQDGGSCEPPDDCPGCRADCVEYGDGLGPRCVWGSGECLSDADCTAGDNGRCWDNRGLWFCTYDTCYSDATCTSGGPCACEGESGSAGNTCLPGNCQTDRDCAGNGFCSPTFGGCGNYSGVIAYYCHTAADTCLDDADCVSPTQGPGYCMYAPEVGHWSCGYGQCVG